VEDITERKHAEEKLHMLLSEFEDKNKELRKAYEELKMSEAMLIQSEKMASLGQLSAGIAHELKNPLSIILQGIAYVQSSVEDNTLIDACDRIKKSAIRADTVIHNLLSFSRQASPSFSEEDMNILIEESLAMVEHQLNLQNIEVIRNYSPLIPRVSVDGNQIKEVFINIFINAADAMKDGGTITLTITTGTDKDGQPCVKVAITDTGAGIPEEILKKVLDPFFTTKRNSGGTGLGLSVTKGIIERHHGSIVINSKVGAGTTVIMALPCNPLEKGGALNG
jgi:two-component system NtrC family sensor kinase